MAQVQMEIDSVRHSMLKDEWVLVLRGKVSECYLPIWMGPYQAHIIKRELTGTKLSADPAGYESFLAGTDTTEFVLKSVAIQWSADNTYNAKLSFSQRGRNSQVDCSLSRAVALAVKRNAPILVEEEVLDRIAVITKE